ncbi:terpene synthase family protein [Nocardia thraciensis]
MLKDYVPLFPEMRLPQARGPYHRELEAEALHWAAEKGMMHSNRLRRGMRAMALGELAPRTHPFASWEKARIIVHWLAWYGYIDDLYDEVTISENPADYERMLAETELILASDAPLSCRASSVAARATAELWHDTATGMSQFWRVRMAIDLMDWLRVYGRESQHRAECREIELEPYLEFRQHSSSIYSVLNLVETPRTSRFHPSLHPARSER